MSHLSMFLGCRQMLFYRSRVNHCVRLVLWTLIFTLECSTHGFIFIDSYPKSAFAEPCCACFYWRLAVV